MANNGEYDQFKLQLHARAFDQKCISGQFQLIPKSIPNTSEQETEIQSILGQVHGHIVFSSSMNLNLKVPATVSKPHDDQDLVMLSEKDVQKFHGSNGLCLYLSKPCPLYHRTTHHQGKTNCTFVFPALSSINTKEGSSIIPSSFRGKIARISYILSIQVTYAHHAAHRNTKLFHLPLQLLNSIESTAPHDFHKDLEDSSSSRSKSVPKIDAILLHNRFESITCAPRGGSPNSVYRIEPPGDTGQVLAHCRLLKTSFRPSECIYVQFEFPRTPNVRCIQVCGALVMEETMGNDTMEQHIRDTFRRVTRDMVECNVGLCVPGFPHCPVSSAAQCDWIRCSWKLQFEFLTVDCANSAERPQAFQWSVPIDVISPFHPLKTCCVSNDPSSKLANGPSKTLVFN